MFSDASNNLTTRSDRPLTELEQKEQADNSTFLTLYDSTSGILEVSLETEPATCQATKLRMGSDGKLEITGSCVQT